jgi:hypothetical protein
MDRNKQESILKDLKTIKKFLKISKTMLTNIGNENQESKVLALTANTTTIELDKLVNIIDSQIDEFKYEQKIPGCQLKLF